MDNGQSSKKEKKESSPNRFDLILFIFSAVLTIFIFASVPKEAKVIAGVLVTILGFLCTTIFSLLGKTSKRKKDVEKKETATEKARQKLLNQQSINQIDPAKMGDDVLRVEASKDKANNTNKAILVFGIIYSAIAALGFQAAFDFYFNDIHHSISALGLPDLNHSFLILSYLSVAILFYHGGIIFLSSVAAEELTEGKARRVFPDFIVLFLEAAIVYYVAKDIASFQVFTRLIMTLMLVDISWVLYFYSISKGRSVYFEWVHFNLMTFLALLLVSLNGHGTQAYAIVFTVLVSRTICDYAFAWKEFYSVYTAQ
jgi:hypothetical protein